jgi:hypothetical protein
MSLTVYNPGALTFYNPAGSQQQQQPQDDMTSLLNVLAAVFGIYPGLWYDGMAVESYQLVSGLMSFVSIQAWPSSLICILSVSSLWS